MARTHRSLRLAPQLSSQTVREEHSDTPTSPTPADIMRIMGTMSPPDAAQHDEAALSDNDRLVLVASRILADYQPVTHVRPQDLMLPSSAVPQSHMTREPAPPPSPPAASLRSPSATVPQDSAPPPTPPVPTVRRSERLRVPAPPSKNQRCYRVPVPGDTDPIFRIEINAGGRIGVNVHCKGIFTDVPLNSVYAKTVDVDVLHLRLDGFFPDKVVWVQRAFFFCEKPPRDAMLNPSPKNPGTGFTAGHLLTLLAQKQHRNWLHCYMGNMDLQDAVGPQLVAKRGTKIPSDALHNADTIPATVSGLHFLVPLPRDVDATVQIPVTVRGIPGLRIVNCAWINKHMPNEDIMRDVDNASRCIDDLVQLNARRLYVHRAYFPGQTGTDVATRHPQESGFTVGHLLTMMIRKQLDGWIKSFKRMTALVPLEAIAGGGAGNLPNVGVEYKHLYIVAIRRSTGRDGRVRWFPQLEVRLDHL
ncbi:hypothetical protein BV20DRAFT_1125235 [Pilatotrama ljubarskyi]|nr:hypothetical protein BV20DRAFT_1125235 [Pilatotrama ljubarskyi]